jgi:hypothetical protein
VSFFERPNENNFFKQFEHEECDEGTLFWYIFRNPFYFKDI